MSHAICSSFQDCIAYSVLHFYMNFRISLSIRYEMALEVSEDWFGIYRSI